MKMNKFLDKMGVKPKESLGSVQIEGRRYNLIEKIADGGFGQIYRGTGEANQLVAIKILNSSDQERYQLIQKEVEIQRQLSSSPHIVQIFAATSDPGSRQSSIVMEYCSDDLVKEMNRHISTGLNPNEIAEIFCSICSAVDFMHKQSPPITHRDLKIENVLKSNGIWKLCDFGSATRDIYDMSNTDKIAQISEDIQKNTTPCYRAPEMADLYRGEIIGPKSDIWALGCILFKMCTFKDAFPDGSNLAILNGRYNWNCGFTPDPRLKEIAESCMRPRPDDRPSASDLVLKMKELFGVTPETSMPHQMQVSISSPSVPKSPSTSGFSKPQSSPKVMRRSSSAVGPLVRSDRRVIDSPQPQAGAYISTLLNAPAPPGDESDISDIECDIDDMNDQMMEAPPVSDSAGAFARLGSDVVFEDDSISPSASYSISVSQQSQSQSSENTSEKVTKNLPEFKPDFSAFEQQQAKAALAPKGPAATEDVLIDFGGPKPQPKTAQNQVTSQSQNLDDLFGVGGDVDKHALYDTNPNVLREELQHMGDVELTTTLFKLVGAHPETGCLLWILNVAHFAGPQGTKIIQRLPAMPTCHLATYLDARKRFAVSFPQFEGNLSLHEFTQQNRASPPPVGTPPICLDALRMLQAAMDTAPAALRETPVRFLLDDIMALYQATAYVLAKLVQFRVSPGFVQATSIPLYGNEHRSLKRAIADAGLEIHFPDEPFDMGDQNVLKRLRPPPSKVAPK